MRGAVLTPLRHRLELGAFLAARAVVRALPHACARPLGAALGALIWPLDRRHRRVALHNVGLAFPQWPASRRRAVARASFRHLGATAVDTLSFARFDPVEICRRLTLSGWDRLDAAVAEGKGVLLVSAHLGNWEVAAWPGGFYRAPLHIVHRPMANARLYEELMVLRHHSGQRLIAKSGAAREVFRVLRNQGLVGIVMDQRVRPSQGIVVPFFGHPALATPLPASVSLRTGAPVVAVFAHPQPHGRFLVEVTPPIDPAVAAGEDDPVAALTERYLARIEEQIRRHPEQWLWAHRRWRLD